MAAESKSFVSQTCDGSKNASARTLNSDDPVRVRVADLANWTQVGLVFAVIMLAVWTPQGRFNSGLSLLAVFCILWLTFRGPYSARELGFTRPASGAVAIFAAGALITIAIAASGPFTRILGPAHAVPWSRAWQYAIWALAQEFILQSFFYVRLESILGGWRALLATAFLFAVAHIPSPLLTAMSFFGALFFCEMFRRYRNIFPLGLVHAVIGLTIAASLPDRLLHHMRVGIGFLQYHP